MSVSVERRLILQRMAQAAIVCGAALCAASDQAALAGRLRRLPQLTASARWTAARPVVVSRAHWDTADTRSLPPVRYAAVVKAAVIHHTDSGNDYDPGDVPEIIRNIHLDQTTRQGWDDIGYNFLVTRDGKIYEGRHGGIARPVEGAHALGFNRDTVGIAAIGTFGPGVTPPAEMLDAIARLVAWKLGMHSFDPRSTTTLTCSNPASRYPEGAQATLDAVCGHRDADWTLCPGASLYALLPRIRAEAARLQGRTRTRTHSHTRQ